MFNETFILPLPLINFQALREAYNKITLTGVLEACLCQSVFVGNNLFLPVMKCQKPSLIHLHIIIY